jgi:hypothetical protein
MSSSFKMILLHFEHSPSDSFSLLDVAQAHHIPHRRAYDFFSFLTAFGVCLPVTRGSLRWTGLLAIRHTLANAYAQIEIAACDTDMGTLFAAWPSPSLGSLAKKFACFFLFLGVEVLSIRTVARLLHDGAGDARSFARRLYLAVSFLESAMIVEHTPKVSEYRLVIERAPIVAAGMAARKEHLRQVSDRSLENLLSRYEERFMSMLYAERQAEFDRIVGK